ENKRCKKRHAVKRDVHTKPRNARKNRSGEVLTVTERCKWQCRRGWHGVLFQTDRLLENLRHDFFRLRNSPIVVEPLRTLGELSPENQNEHRRNKADAKHPSP